MKYCKLYISLNKYIVVVVKHPCGFLHNLGYNHLSNDNKKCYVMAWWLFVTKGIISTDFERFYLSFAF